MTTPVVAFRVDASTRIGTGHVMRCLTLANELRKHGVATHFICRAHAGHMAEKIISEAHEVTLLPVMPESTSCTGTGEPSRYASWLGADWIKDAEDTVRSVAGFSPSWLVVDHYAIDARWECSVKATTGARIMAIDGLADRKHDCDLLLDQTYSPEGERRWAGLVPASCKLFVGPKFALLRPEFVEARRILRAREGRVGRIFIAFGGIDEPNATSVALEAIFELGYPDVVVDVVIGRSNPHLAQLQAMCQPLQNVNLHVQPDNVAELMRDADLAISAGGTLLLEQCYLHLPSVIVTIADNQVRAAQALHRIGAVMYLGGFSTIEKESIKQSVSQLINDKPQLMKMQLVAEKLMEEPEMSVSQALLREL